MARIHGAGDADREPVLDLHGGPGDAALDTAAVGLVAPALRLPDRPLVDAAAGIVLRPWHEDDVGALAAAWAVPDIGRQATPPGHGDPEAAARWIADAPARLAAGVALDLAVVAADDPAAVWGEVGLARLHLRAGDRERTEVEVGWWTLPAHRGRGVAGAAASVVVAWARRDLGLTRVVARIARGHGASEAVARRAGLGRVGRLDAGRDLWALPVVERRGAPAARPGDGV